MNKIALSSNDDKRMQSIDSIETYAYGMDKGVACKKEESKCKNITKQYKIVYITKEDIKEHNTNWPEIPDHPYRILTVGGSRSLEKQMYCLI